jgi:hypothetical protein
VANMAALREGAKASNRLNHNCAANLEGASSVSAQATQEQEHRWPRDCEQHRQPAQQCLRIRLQESLPGLWRHSDRDLSRRKVSPRSNS